MLCIAISLSPLICGLQAGLPWDLSIIPMKHHLYKRYLVHQPKYQHESTTRPCFGSVGSLNFVNDCYQNSTSNADCNTLSDPRRPSSSLFHACFEGKSGASYILGLLRLLYCKKNMVSCMLSRLLILDLALQHPGPNAEFHADLPTGHGLL